MLLSPTGPAVCSPSGSPTKLPWGGSNNPPYWSSAIAYYPGLINADRIDKKTPLYPITISQSNCGTFNAAEKITVAGLAIPPAFYVEIELIPDTRGYYEVLDALPPEGVGRDFVIKLRNDGKVWLRCGDTVVYSDVQTPVIYSAGVAVKVKFIVSADKTVECVVDDVSIGTIGTLTIVPDGVVRSRTIGQRTLTPYEAYCGKAYHVDINGVVFPISEGGGSTVEDTTGAYAGTVTAASITDFWAGRQNTYHRNSVSGWWESSDSDGVFYVTDPGSGTWHPGNKWNGAESSYTAPEIQAIIDQDALEGPLWTDGAGNMVSVTEAEITAFVVGKTATFFSQSRGLTIYGSEQTGTALATIQTWNGITLTAALNPDGSAMLNPDGSQAYNPT